MVKPFKKRIRWQTQSEINKRKWEDESRERIISVRVTILSGKMIDFAVVLRVPVARELREIARYDYAHGFVHIDIQRETGEPLRHQYRDKIPLKQAVRYATDDFQANWQTYLDFYQGKKTNI